eukprot:Tbor_TRINITY_DN4791_c0_g2::TRINITY_DN4791_c0_g2_i1::g.17074::m.17074
MGCSLSSKYVCQDDDASRDPSNYLGLSKNDGNGGVGMLDTSNCSNTSHEFGYGTDDGNISRRSMSVNSSTNTMTVTGPTQKQSIDGVIVYTHILGNSRVNSSIENRNKLQYVCSFLDNVREIRDRQDGVFPSPEEHVVKLANGSMSVSSRVISNPDLSSNATNISLQVNMPLAESSEFSFPLPKSPVRAGQTRL